MRESPLKKIQPDRLLGPFLPLAMIVKLAFLVLLAAAPLLAPIAGVAALALYHLQPALIFGGQPLSPRGLVLSVLLRVPIGLLRWVRELFGVILPDADDSAERLRPVYTELLARGLDPFFEPRRATCPLCDGAELELAVETPDIFQGKPGSFRVERCRGCGHIFQNPRLSIEGLNFYYRDFYDGLGGEQMEILFGYSAKPYRSRAHALKGNAEPRRWIDIGAGHGHFCCTAREIWPETRFDGLDMSSSIDDAVRRGWIDTGYRGLFPDFAPKLAGMYDVVSMHHYLEHTRDPRAELAAAEQVLSPGGHLLIEVPNPDSALSRILRGLWLPWFQPQHQHFLTMENLERLLAERGFTPVNRWWSEVHSGADLLLAVNIVLNRIAPPEGLPWRPRASLPLRLVRILIRIVTAPVLLLALLADKLLDPIFRTRGWSDAYRILARKGAPS
jgi:SAM-dependent methyltransferase